MTITIHVFKDYFKQRSTSKNMLKGKRSSLKYFIVMWIVSISLIAVDGTCQERQHPLPQGRQCRKACQHNRECRSNKRKCQCDGICGMSCIKPNQECKPLGNIPNGRVDIKPNNRFGAVAQYFCEDDFTLEGDQTRMCQGDGTWSGLIPMCLADQYNARSCGFPGDIENGWRTDNEFTFQNVVKYFCHDGFYLNGQKYRTCQADGRWSGTKPTCEPVVCPKLFAPLYGHMQGDGTGYGMIIRFSCENGYKNIGSTTRRCQSDGTWSGTAAKCEEINCGWPGPFYNGYLIGDKTTVGSTIFFSCIARTSFEGDTFHTKCLETGEWSNQPPICWGQCQVQIIPNATLIDVSELKYVKHGVEVQFQCKDGLVPRDSSSMKCNNGTWSSAAECVSAVVCPKLFAPVYGHMQGDGTGYGMIISFSCENGYKNIGSTTKRCQSDGTWSGTAAKCEEINCGWPGSFYNGYMIGHKTTVGSTIFFSCIARTSFEGDTFQTKCLETGEWSNPPPICWGQCQVPIIPNARIIDVSELKYVKHGVEVQFQCKDGLVARDSSSIKCNNGTWSSAAECVPAVACPKPFAPVNGHMQGDGTGYGMIISFSCENGYKNIGSTTRRCQSDSTWSGTAAKCEEVNCGWPGPFYNGYLIGYKTTVGYSIFFSCIAKTTIEGDTFQAVCLETGEWSNPPPICWGQCQVPIIPNATIIGGSELKYVKHGVEVQFQCKDGLIARDSSSMQCYNGTWSSAAECVPAVACPKPFAPVNGHMQGDGTGYGMIISFSCENGYKNIGSTTRRCQSDSTWSGTAAKCEEVNCGWPGPFYNGYLIGYKTTVGYSIFFSCIAKTTIEGDTFQAVCLETGEWSNPPPICWGQCQVPIIPNATIIGGSELKYVKHGVEVQFQCKDGLIARDSSSMKCYNGTWSSAAECVPACPKLFAPEYGHMQGDGTGYGIISFCCENGYKNTGSTTRRCQSDSTWSGTAAKCEAIACPELFAPVYGHMQGYGTGYGMVINFGCENGYKNVGSTTRRCTSDSTWSGTAAKCEEVNCGWPGPFYNGYLIGHKTTVGNTIIFSCIAQTTIEGGAFQAVCLETGEWSNPPPICSGQCKVPIIPNATIIGGSALKYVEHGEEVQFQCKDGLVPRDSSSMKCYNGTWSSSAECVSGQCQVPIIPNATIIGGSELKYVKHGVEVQFQCKDGLVPRDSSSMKCYNGTWSSAAECVPAVACPKLFAPVYGHMQGDGTGYGMIISFSCENGYKNIGSTTRRCQSDGTWSGTAAKCEEVNCGWPGPFYNGYLIGHKTTVGYSIFFSCISRTTIEGDTFQAVCLETGEWSNPPPICWGQCKVPIIPNATIIGGSELKYVEHGVEVQFQCKDGLVPRDSSSMKCYNGTWSSAAECVPVYCPNPGTIEHGKVYKKGMDVRPYIPSIRHGYKLVFDCDNGYRITGPGGATCVNGQWQPPLNHSKCEPAIHH